MSLTPQELSRYSRHLALSEIGITGQEKLKAARVLVVGAGGLGSPALLYLAAAGVGTIGIVEFDRVDISNLQRQVLFDSAQIGQSKAHAAAHRLQALNPTLNIQIHEVELQASNIITIIGDYDLVLDGTDQFAARYLINDVCVLLRKSLVSAAIHRFEGQLFTYVPNLGPCFRCLFPASPAENSIPNCAQAGVLGVLPGVMGSLQATEAIKLIAGIGEPLIGRLMTYDALSMNFSEFKFSARSDCAVCGLNPSIIAPQDRSSRCDSEQADTISINQLHALLETDRRNTLLIDVREQYEFSTGHIEGAVNIPLSDLSHASIAADEFSLVVFICRSGGRSAHACQWFKSHSQVKTLNATGGMLAWQQAIDSSVLVV
jgi:molybdopterin/thiamine biosynthesis adenylyltransferase/rhodanese-related sulfurtransferase